MQIVIDISDDLYYEIQAYKTIFDEHNSELTTVINDGKLLPKGHGRLVDADAYAKKYDTKINGRIGEEYVFAPTIIEADKYEE